MSTDALPWGAIDDQGIVHALSIDQPGPNGVSRMVQTRCSYGTVRNGEAVHLVRAVSTCVWCAIQ